MTQPSISTEALTRLKRSPMISEEFINRFYQTEAQGGERKPDPALDSMSAVLRRSRETCDSVTNLAAALSSDPTMTPAAAALALRDRAGKALDPVLKQSDRARAEITGEIDRTWAQLDALPSPGTQADALLEGEMRAALARMTDKERSKVLSEAFDGDQRIVAAALRGPAMLSGLGAQEQAGWRRRWQESRDPAAFERVGRLQEALGAFDRSMNLVVDFYGSTANVSGVEQALKAQALTAQAMAAVGAD